MKTNLIVLLCLLTGFVFAEYVNPVSYYGTKKAGMGGTGVAVVDTRESIMYNPAHVVDVAGHYTIPFIQGTFTAGSETIPNLKKLSTTGDNSTDIVNQYQTIIPSKAALGYNSAGYCSFDLGLGALGLGMYTQAKLAANVVNRLSPRFDAIGYADIAFPTITYGRMIETADSFFLKNLKLGATVKRIMRTSIYDTNKNSEQVEIEVLNLLDSNNQGGLNTRVGTAYGLDLGMLSDIDTFMGPVKLGAAITNISTSFTGIEHDNVNSDNATERPFTQRVPMLGTVGMAMKASPFVSIPFIDAIFPDATYATDFDFIAQDNSFFKRLHMGMEQAYFNRLLALRMGLNQGYPTIGLDLNLAVYHLGFTYYTEELGAEIGDNPQSYYVLDGGFYW